MPMGPASAWLGPCSGAPSPPGAFPPASGTQVRAQAPSPVPPARLKELHLQVVMPPARKS